VQLRVAYPAAGSQVTARDSTFVFGSVGTGDAELTIDGVSVPVAPNGAFLAFIGLPADTAAALRLVARRAGDSVVLEHRLRLPRRFVPPAGLWLDPASVEPRGARWAEPGEAVRVSLHAAGGAAVELRLPDGSRVPLVPDTVAGRAVGVFDRGPAREEPAVTRYAGSFGAVPLGAGLPPVTTPRTNAAPGDSGLAEIVVARGTDTVRAPLPLRLAVVGLDRPVVVLDDDTARTGRTRGAAVGMPMPGGTYEWFFRNGTTAAVSGRVGDEVRVHLSQAASAWVPVSEIGAVLPPGTAAPFARVALVRLTPGERSVVARFSLGARVPFHVSETDRALTVRLYGAQSDLDWLQYGTSDTLVRRMTAAQPAEDEVTVTFELGAPVFGYRTRWDGADLLLEIRRPPVIDRRRPLRGRIIAVDPGHPPAGAIGPTGLTEAEANLGVGLALRRLLEAAGARVVMTRTTGTALDLYPRVAVAESADAEVLVSLHNNAFPDGVNPFVNNGTSTYYFHPRAARLAWYVQRALLRRLGLRDIGYGRGNYALVRPTWMPSVLTEGAFLMIPEQEQALRTPAFRERYARGVLEGIAAWLRELAGP
jgi:N-acetylmuramoyl-L-alanine amidase